MSELKKRTWVFVHNPVRYDIRCNKCWDGEINDTGTKITWSEYEHLIWCYDCGKDLAGTAGIFDGPVPIGVTELFGTSLNRIYLKSRKMFKLVVAEGGRGVYRQCGRKDIEKFTLVHYPKGKKSMEICICDMPWGPCSVHGMRAS